MEEVKKLSVANFNITYGSEYEPMLAHFHDILFPALCSDWKVRNSKNISYFSDIELKQFDSEYVLTGNLIRETFYRVRTVVVDEKLVASPNSIPTAPYSRFIIYLKSHRMVLVKNEGQSPSLKSFQAVLRKVVEHFLREKNRERKKLGLECLPSPLINIVNMPLSADVEKTIMEFEKINSINLRFFPLNNDLDPNPLFELVRAQMDTVDSKTGNLTFNSPKSPGGISSLFEDSIVSGVAEATVRGVKKDGTHVRITDNQLGSELRIPIGGNLSHNDDSRIVAYCSDHDLIPKASPENQDVYEHALCLLETIVNKLR